MVSFGTFQAKMANWRHFEFSKLLKNWKIKVRILDREWCQMKAKNIQSSGKIRKKLFKVRNMVDYVILMPNLAKDGKIVEGKQVFIMLYRDEDAYSQNKYFHAQKVHQKNFFYYYLVNFCKIRH